MILTCPECATRYFVDDARLGQGRTVRCAACGSAWRAAGEEPLVLETSDEEGAVARAPEPLSFRPVDKADLAAPELPKAFRAAAERRRKSRAAAAMGVVWATLGCALIGLLAAAWIFRVEVVRFAPRTAAAYAMIGAPVNPTGLEFEAVRAAAAPGVAGSVTVSGRIRNIQTQAVTPPPLRVSLLDAKGAVVSARIAPGPGLIGAGKVKPFSVVLSDPDAKAADVGVAFALDIRAPARAIAPPRRPKDLRPAAAAPDPAEAALRPPVGVERAADEAQPLDPADPLALKSPSAPLEPIGSEPKAPLRALRHG